MAPGEVTATVVWERVGFIHVTVSRRGIAGSYWFTPPSLGLKDSRPVPFQLDGKTERYLHMDLDNQGKGSFVLYVNGRLLVGAEGVEFLTPPCKDRGPVNPALG